MLKGHRDFNRLVRSLFRGDAKDEEMVIVRGVCRILKFKTLMAYVPEIPVP